LCIAPTFLLKSKQNTSFAAEGAARCLGSFRTLYFAPYRRHHLSSVNCVSSGASFFSPISPIDE
jgi:hypothetical protein